MTHKNPNVSTLGAVKKLTLFLFFFILAISLWAEETPEETGTEEPKKSGGFGGPVLKVTQINDVFGLLVGGRGGWVYKHKYAIGGGFYGLLRDIEVEVPDASERDFEFAYSGLELEYIVAPRSRYPPLSPDADRVWWVD